MMNEKDTTCGHCGKVMTLKKSWKHFRKCKKRIANDAKRGEVR
jgi:hypothetical protein